MSSSMIAGLPLLMVFTMMMMVMLNNPISMLILLLLYSFQVVIWVSYMYSSWLALCVFLVYVGAILVLFVSTCMLSSNYTLGNLKHPLLYSLVLMLISPLVLVSPNTVPTLGTNSATSVESVGALGLLGLVFYLLLSFLVILMILFSNRSTLKIESEEF